jgi:fido (protein-threonine AMPylation protein)
VNVLTPAYGETPVPDDELEALLPQARQLLDEPVSKAAVYDLEQGIQAQVAEELFPEVLSGERSLEDLLNDHFLRELHRRLYGDIWIWAGVIRTHELNIGIDPWQIVVELRNSMENIKYRWDHTDDWSPRQLGIAAHAELVRIHPFADGNGRSTRFLADLVYVAAQLISTAEDAELLIYDWHVEKMPYISLLRSYDGHRDPKEIAAFVPVLPLDDQSE